MNNVIPFPDRFDQEGTRWEPLVDATVVARHFNVTTRTVRRWRDLGMPSIPQYSGCRYRLSECERWHREAS